MKSFAFGLIVLFVCLSAISAPLPPSAREEVMTLLSRLESSTCQFNRNGTWYSGAEAKAHLVRKLEHVERKASPATTEEFIDLAATTSSSSGKAYLVKCGSTEAVSSASWLRRELQQLRRQAPGK
jgi:Family of unknown function (DUF5329)